MKSRQVLRVIILFYEYLVVLPMLKSIVVNLSLDQSSVSFLVLNQELKGISYTNLNIER